jgi:hypothetical protein
VLVEHKLVNTLGKYHHKLVLFHLLSILLLLAAAVAVDVSTARLVVVVQVGI